MIDKRKGFTLVELLVVLGIVGLLASIVLNSLNNERRDRRDARREGDMQQVHNALELYSHDNGGLFPRQSKQGTLPQVLATNYLSILPIDPLAGNLSYQYISDSSGHTYCVGARLEGVAPIPASTCKGVVLNSKVNYSIGN